MSEKVGTELSKLIPDWAVQFKAGCGCKNMVNHMDKWGVEGCIKNKNFILAHLMSQSDRLIPVFRMVPDSIKKIGAQKLLKKAIMNAKANA
jgi:hypothetical protein